MSTPGIRSFEPISPKIYAYDHPDYPAHQGMTKIGYTEKQTVEARVKGQNGTNDIAYRILWSDRAMYRDGSGLFFTDHEFHRYLTNHAHVKRKPGTEWFYIGGDTARAYFNAFAARRPADGATGLTYTLRDEQERAAAQTAQWFSGGGEQFLWNAKPRFGKTLTTYDLIRRMGFRRVLIVTNRPSIANSWAEDFTKFIGWRGELLFVSDTDSLRGKPGVLTREEYTRSGDGKGFIAFVSLQDLKGSLWFGGEYRKLDWIAAEYRDDKGEKQKGLAFDLLVVDEAQEGTDTIRTDVAFQNICRSHTLYLSGTPFKMLAGSQFSDEEIFNWSYADEQEAKASWQGEGYNPYENLPQLQMYTYQLGPMVSDTVSAGLTLEDGEEPVDYCFDLNEFFRTDEGGKLLHREEVKKFLLMLFRGEKYPFSTPELRQELSHTMWYLNRVASAKALHKLMREDAELKPLFAEYEIILAAGDGRLTEEEETLKAFDRVTAAIEKHAKTITLTVGQLTVGVTIPEWSGVFMLCNMKSPSSYMQAAFRAQNPCTLRDAEGNCWRKERAYLFDFDPARTLTIYDQFANNLRRDASSSSTEAEREANIRRLLNFFPVLGEDEEGEMVELDPAAVLTIPNRLKSAEVVRRGFMSNLLFADLGNVFGAPAFVREILEKLPFAREEAAKKDKGKLDGMEDIRLDGEGNALPDPERVIGVAHDLFGEKIYAELPPEMEKLLSHTEEEEDSAPRFQAVGNALKEKLAEEFIPAVAEGYGMTGRAQKRMEAGANREIDAALRNIEEGYNLKKRQAEAALELKKAAAQTEEETRRAEAGYRAELREIGREAQEALTEVAGKTLREKPVALVEEAETQKAESARRAAEDAIRDHLRGFARTIPSFLMAYGDEHTELANFDTYVEDEVFPAVSAITKAEFRLLRDGGDRRDPLTGQVEHFGGHVFNEAVFNASVRAFLEKRRALANYFDESLTEDIFDYIPPQKTNQIFTPRRIVKLMVDKLEEENPGCFDDPEKTFADLYMKSGLYITEIVKRLFRSAGLKAAYPDEKERIRHILTRQVYGMAPTRIIYRIATNFILGFDEALRQEDHNFVLADAAEAAKEGTLARLVEEHFGE